jgi:hypothetical protein
MPIDVPDNYPCSICENFAGRYPWHGAPAVVHEDETPFPPEKDVPITPSDERELMAQRLRLAWEAVDW